MSGSPERERSVGHGTRAKQAQHGTYSKYVGGCRCALCGEASRTYQRAYYRRPDRVLIAAEIRSGVREVKHGSSGYNRGCRCDECRKGHRDYAREKRQREARESSLSRKHRASGIAYRSNCGCEHCKQGKAAYWQARSAAIQQGHAEVASHGVGGYRQGCRCDVCREAMRVRVAELRQRKRAARDDE